MGTTKDKLKRALDSKRDIRSALSEVTGSDPGNIMRHYSQIIRGLCVCDCNKPEGIERINILLSSNQPEIDEGLFGIEVRVTYEGFDETYTWQGVTITLDIPTGLEYTVTAGEVENYKSPESLSYTSTSEEGRVNTVIIGSYLTEDVTVNVSANDGASVDGQLVNVTTNDVTTSHTVKDGKVQFKVEHGLEYDITMSDKDGYVTPSSQSFTSESALRSVSMMYEKILHSGTMNPTNGVYILDTDGYFHNEAEWDGTYTADCVAVITSNCRFGIALTENPSNEVQILSVYSGELENYMTAMSTSTKAKADYDGAENTTNIMKVESSTNYAAGWCNAFSFPSGKKGYLGAAGQWWAAYSNKAAVDAAIAKAGGTRLKTQGTYWTSTFYGVNSDDYRSCWHLDWLDGDIDHNYVTNEHYVRAFSAL